MPLVQLELRGCLLMVVQMVTQFILVVQKRMYLLPQCIIIIIWHFCKKINTPLAKKIAINRSKYMKRFFDELEKEVSIKQ